MNMKGLWLGLAVGTTFTCLLGQWVFSAASKETDPCKGISPEIVADYVHSVVQADRTLPDKAVSQFCADCHNVHPKSLKTDFKAGDVMGGLLITIALPQG